MESDLLTQPLLPSAPLDAHAPVSEHSAETVGVAEPAPVVTIPEALAQERTGDNDVPGDMAHAVHVPPGPVQARPIEVEEHRPSWWSYVGWAFPLCYVLWIIWDMLLSVETASEDSFYCRYHLWTKRSPVYAPLVCFVPLVTTSSACHLYVVCGVICYFRFLWRLSVYSPGGGTENMHLRLAELSETFKYWRSWGVGLLLLASTVYILMGPYCIVQSQYAVRYLALGLMMLYTGLLCFDGVSETGRLGPRAARIVVAFGIIFGTFKMNTHGSIEYNDGSGFVGGPDNYNRSIKEGGAGTNSWILMQLHDEADAKKGVPRVHGLGLGCTSGGRRFLSPPECVVPLELACAFCFWWCASGYLFDAIIPSSRMIVAGDVTVGVRMMGSIVARLRRALQRYRDLIDVILLSGSTFLLWALDGRCKKSAPVAMQFCWIGFVAVLIRMILRRRCPRHCDQWAGPLSHLRSPPLDLFAGDASPQQCSVCLENIVRHQYLLQTPCRHVFHSECLEEWVQARRFRAPGCPLCRELL